jgi:hypothetical protein
MSNLGYINNMPTAVSFTPIKPVAKPVTQEKYGAMALTGTVQPSCCCKKCGMKNIVGVT